MSYLNYFRDKRCLVTGGGGFIGSALVRRLLALGATTFSLDADHDSPSVPLVGVADRGAVKEVFAAFRPEVVFHLAAQAEVIRSHREPYRTWIANVLGTLHVLEACRVQGVKAIVAASSDKAYGEKPVTDMPYQEGMPLCSKGDFYAASKRAADDLCHDYGRLFGLPVRVMRAANTYGPGQRNTTTLITGTVARIRHGLRPVIHRGAESIKREWLYVDDAVDAYLRLAHDAATEKEGAASRNTRGHFAWNVGSGEVLTVGAVVKQTMQALGAAPGVDRLNAGAPQIGDQWLDSGKFRCRFPDWAPTPFAEGLQRTVDWHVQQERL